MPPIRHCSFRPNLRFIAAALLSALMAYPPAVDAGPGETGWTQATESAEWAPRWKHTSVSFDGKLWVMGGDRSLNDVWSSIDGETWNLKTASAPWGGREDFASVVFDGKIWVLGGRDYDSIRSYNDVWSSTDGATWTEATPEAPWSVRFGHAAVVHEDEIWLTGGYDRGYLNDVWRSSDGEDWTAATLDGGWPGRADFSAVSFDGKLWIMGGNAGDPGTDRVVLFNDVWASSDGISWNQTTGAAPWSKRRTHTSVVSGGRIWLMGGGWPSFHLVPPILMTNEVWTSTNGSEWNQEAPPPGWDPRGEHTTVVHKDAIWILGGVSDMGYQNDVWYFPSAAFPTRSDINEDGFVDSTDLLIFLKDWGKVTEP